MSPAGAIEEMTPVPDAYVPIIKLEYCGVSIDLIFASLNLSSIPLNLDLKENSLLRGLDESGIRSVNGTRVTDMILDLVPQPKVFRTALRTIKLWAQRRACYANVIGFPGGVQWAMLVARVAQLYPQATGSTLVGKFFNIIRQWPWPQPVLLKDLEHSGPIQARTWNPAIYRGDAFHLMPVITPAFPSMCATHNVTTSTKQIIMDELTRGIEICNKIGNGKLAWKDLFAKHNFFTLSYKHYLSVTATSRTKDAEKKWSGLIESKVRLLVSELEKEETIDIAHPFNKGFQRVHHCVGDQQIDEVIKGDLKFQVKEIKTETTDATNDPQHNAAVDAGANDRPLGGEVKPDDGMKPEDGVEHEGGLKFEDGANDRDGAKLDGVADLKKTDNLPTETMLYTTTYYIGLRLNQTAKQGLDISWAAQRFKDICTSWSSYEEKMNYINVHHVRSFDLPDDVFADGETKPARTKVVNKKSNGAKVDAIGSSLKRKLDLDGAENPDRPHEVKRSSSMATIHLAAK